MYPHNAYYGLAPPYYGFVGLTPMTVTAPVHAVPQIIPNAVPTAVPVAVPKQTTVVTTASETSPTAQYVREKPPVTTVFVGNITEHATESLMKALLMRCGNILSWKRVQGASGKLQAFGFCEFEDPESTMRCVRLLNGFKVGAKNLLVKVDPKTEDLLEEYKKKKAQTGEEGTLGATADEVDTSTQRDDEDVKCALMNIVKESASVLEGEESPMNDDPYTEGPRHLTMDDMDLDEDRKEIINREIEIFRKRNKKEDKAEPPTNKRRSRARESDQPVSTLQLYGPYVESDRQREYWKEKSRRSRSRSKSPGRTRGTITSSVLLCSEKADLSDEEESLIRKRLERKLRDKEESYQKRLKQWEARERKKANEYEHEREHERKRQRELQIEAQRLKEFFEDYDDDVEDPKYYRGSALNQRMKDREIEEAADERDRQKEIEHIEIARRKLIEERDPNAESVILQMEQKMQEHLRRRLLLDGTDATDAVDNVESSEHGSEELVAENPATSERSKRFADHVENHDHPEDHPSVSPRATSASQSIDRPATEVQRQHLSEFTPSLDDISAVSSKDGAGTFGFAMSAAEPVVRKKAAAFVDEEAEEKTRKKHTPSWLPPSAFKAATEDAAKSSTQKSGDESASIAQLTANMTSEQKKAVIKRIIDGIPTGKRELFNYPIDWDLVDTNFVNARIKPWVDKKIMGYIGEAEATLSNFICDQLVRHNPPERILADIAMVLDEEAEVFVVKMWRLLIYVIAEKKAGLST